MHTTWNELKHAPLTPTHQGAELFDLRAFRARLVDRALGVAAVAAAAAFGISAGLACRDGWETIHIGQAAGTVVIAGTALLRQRLSYRVRVLVILGAFFFIAVNALVHRGLISGGPLALLTATALATAFAGTRAGLTTLVGAMLTLVAIGALVVADIVVVSPDVAAYNAFWSTWMMGAIVFALFATVVVALGGTVLHGLETSYQTLNRRCAHLKEVNDRLLDEIRDRRRAEEQVQEEKRFTEAVIDCLPGMFFAWSEEGRIVRWNEMHQTRFGHPGDEISEASMKGWFAEGDFKRVQAAIELCFEEGEGSVQASALTKDGQSIPHTFYGKRLDRQGQRYMVGFGLDVSESVYTREALEKSERNYREIFNATSEAIFLHDANSGAILDVNQSMLDMYGYRRDQVDGLTVSDVSAGSSDSAQREAGGRLRRAIEEGPQLFEWHAKRFDGSEFWVEVALRSTQIGGDDRVLAVVRDISERKRLEQAAAIQRGLAVQLNSVTELTEGLEICLRAAMDISDMSGGGIYLIDKVSGDLTLAVHAGLSEEFVEAARQYGGDSGHAAIVMQGKPFFYKMGSPDVADPDGVRQSDVRSVAVVPVLHQHDVVACVNLASTHCDEIPHTVRPLLESVAGQIGGAVARLAAEQELREKQGLVDALLDRSPGAIYIKDLEGRYL